jgi:hypothetical protein
MATYKMIERRRARRAKAQAKGRTKFAYRGDIKRIDRAWKGLESASNINRGDIRQ